MRSRIALFHSIREQVISPLARELAKSLLGFSGLSKVVAISNNVNNNTSLQSSTGGTRFLVQTTNGDDVHYNDQYCVSSFLPCARRILFALITRAVFKHLKNFQAKGRLCTQKKIVSEQTCGMSLTIEGSENRGPRYLL